ncbi:S41 family peptidase [Psychrosphaera ytuae]|uniref:S41 family peptidase n=1 Tax=Psychrosphaera ytuae TaxID=2820710 RepID=A0A975DDA6_9GAMM|nr:S41 family peptidase [Psychrosphaera ytuae]QTH65047.1 S41 family peptidase [Psychrosphaera ytuae]
MKKILLFSLLFCSYCFASDESKILSPAQQTEIIETLQNKLTTHYILADKAQEAKELLEELKQSTTIQKPTDKKSFAQYLQQQVQMILNDKHFRVIVPRPRNTSSETDILKQHLNALTNFRKGGFQDIQMLEGNVGYVKIDGFRGEETHQVDGLMIYLRTADAIIIDLRDNRGGARPVNYLTSYFLPEGTLVGSTYHRFKDSWQSHYVDKINGDKRLDVPLFILTSDRTFSAAEAFTYNLQARQRAIVVGEVTGGGAHPIQFFELPEGLATIVPNRRSHNPVTRTNWEGTGVKPDINVDEELALNEAKALAKTAAEQYRSTTITELSNLLNPENVDKTQNKADLEQKAQSLIEILLQRKHLESFMLEGFARRYRALGNDFAAEQFESVDKRLNETEY